MHLYLEDCCLNGDFFLCPLPIFYCLLFFYLLIYKDVCLLQNYIVCVICVTYFSLIFHLLFCLVIHFVVQILQIKFFLILGF